MLFLGPHEKSLAANSGPAPRRSVALSEPTVILLMVMTKSFLLGLPPMAAGISALGLN
jgi:hypothetical protein